MEKTRTIYRGISKASFKNKKEYSFTEAQDILGFCKRKEITYLKQEQIWNEVDYRQYYDMPTVSEWSNQGKAQILEKFDVWVNERGDMLLAQPLPENTLNINDFKI